MEGFLEFVAILFAIILGVACCAGLSPVDAPPKKRGTTELEDLLRRQEKERLRWSVKDILGIDFYYEFYSYLMEEDHDSHGGIIFLVGNEMMSDIEAVTLARRFFIKHLRGFAQAHKMPVQICEDQRGIAIEWDKNYPLVTKRWGT